MKSLLISGILIIFSIGHIHAESSESEEYDRCYVQAVNQSRLEVACIDKVFNHTEFMNVLTTTIAQYTGDDDAVRAQSDKYCPILYQVVECTLIANVIDKDCLSPAVDATHRQSYNIMKSGLNYVCANRSDVIIQILQYNGWDTFFENKKVMSCIRSLDQLQSIDPATLRVSSEFCDGIDEAYECYANSVRDHKNQNLIRIASEFRDLQRQLLDCEFVNQL